MQSVPFPPPPGPALYTVPSPGFVAPPPTVRNAHLIPAAERAAMQPAWGAGRYPPVDVGIHHVQDATLAHEGLVFRPGLDLVPASITQHDPAEIAAARAAIATAATIPTLDGPHVLCVKRGALNYGHWLAEMLPMALLAKRLLSSEVRFLVPPATGALGASIAASLALAGIAPERIVRLGRGPCRVQNLLLVQGLSLHGLYLSPLVSDLLDELAAPIAAAPGGGVWASRAGQPRSLWDEAAVQSVLAGQGWRVADPGLLPFTQQIALFKGAALVGGVMGAGLANLLFAPAGTRVELFAPSGMPDTFFYLIGCLRGLCYRETRCVQTTSPYGRAAWDCGLVHSLPEVLATLG